MSERIPQSVAKRVVFRAYLASDGKTPATGKTIAITISKDGATSFSNPAAGATNATEMSFGFYKFTLGTGDTDTQGPLAWRGAEGTIDDAGDVYTVVSAHNAGFDGIGDAVAGASGGTLIAGSNAATTFASATVTGALTVSDGIIVTASTTNRSAIRATGNGSGHGIFAIAGATGHGFNATSTAGAGFAVAGGTDNPGIVVTGQGNANAVTLNAAGSGNALHLVGGTTGFGLRILGGSTSGQGIRITTTSGDGISISPTDGHAINAAGNGTDKHGMLLTGGTSGTCDGLSCVAGTGGVDIRGDITGDLVGSINGLTAAAVKDLFDTDSTTNYASAVSGSLVKEIADNAGGGGSGASATELVQAMFNVNSGETHDSAVPGSVVYELLEVAGANTAPTVEDIRIEMDANSTQLAAILAAAGASSAGAGGSGSAQIVAGSTDVVRHIRFGNVTGLTAADISLAYSRTETDDDVTDVDVTSFLNDLSTLDDPHTDWGFLEVNATTHPGLYRLDIADAVVASGATGVTITGIATASGVQAELDFDLVTPLTVSDIADATRDAVLNATAASFNTAGSIGQKINSAGASADPWAVLTSFGYGAGTYGKLVVDNLNASVSSRAPLSTAVSSADLTLTRIARLDQIADIDAVTAKLDTAMEANEGLYRFTEPALALAPAGGGGGGTSDWTTDEKTAIRSILGIPASGTTPEDPSSGILDTIRDAVVTGPVPVNVVQVAGSSGAADSLERVVRGNVRGVATSGATTTSIPTSSLSPAATVADQFKGRILTFDDSTSTAALRGQSTDITASSSGGVLTVTALTTSPANGDTFTIS